MSRKSITLAGTTYSYYEGIPTLMEREENGEKTYFQQDVGEISYSQFKMALEAARKAAGAFK